MTTSSKNCPVNPSWKDVKGVVNLFATSARTILCGAIIAEMCVGGVIRPNAKIVEMPGAAVALTHVKYATKKSYASRSIVAPDTMEKPVASVHE